MRVSYNWLQEYVDLDVPPKQLGDRLTMAGLEVEEVFDRFNYLKPVLVVRVDGVEDHPKSDHLKICQVNTQGRTFSVVCGAPNVRLGMFTAWAPPGTELPGGQKVGEAEIRGVRSVGMLCSEAELMVGPDASGIISFNQPVQVDESLKDALKLEDWVFEISITPNRPDCLSMIGVAREVAAITGRRLKYPQVHIDEGSTPIEDLTSVTLEAPEYSPRYVARVILGIKIAPSPFWLADRLAAVGVRSINNVVDITNFVMLETGQPLHAFDMDRLDEKRIVVRTADEGERFTTLDGVERIMGPEMLMICDGSKAVGLAGIMGGLNSEIEDDTTNVLLESAYFSPTNVRRTAKTLEMSTEASFRFERGNDPNGCLRAANRAIAMMAELAGGEVAAGVIDAHPIKPQSVSVSFSPSRCNRFLGTNLDAKRMVADLSALELEVSSVGDDDLLVKVPSFRVDLTREVDLYEEVARLAGYYQVPATIPAARTAVKPLDSSLLMRNRTRDLLEGLGLTEIVTYSFISETFPERLNLPETSRQYQTVRIINPLSEEQSLMRTSLIPGLLEVLRRNQSQGAQSVGLYEIGTLFFCRDNHELPEERLNVSGLLAGWRSEPYWSQMPGPVDFYEIKGLVEDYLDGVGLSDPVFTRETPPAYYDEGATARISSRGRALGWVGRIRPSVGRAFDLREDWGPTGSTTGVFAFELDMEALLEVRQAIPTYRPLPRFPSVSRDMTLNVDAGVEAVRIMDYVRSLGEENLVKISFVSLFDVESKVGSGRKSLSYSLLYRSPERTLTAEEVNIVHARIAETTRQEFGATFS